MFYGDLHSSDWAAKWKKSSYLRKKKIDEFTPIEMAKALKVTNRTIINWAVALARNGLLEPQLVQKRIRSYRVVQCSG